MPNTKNTSNRKLPKHWWEAANEQEEARWWDANFSRLFEEAVRKGTLRMQRVEETIRQAKRRLRSKRQPSKQLTLRISVDVIQAAKRQAAKRRVPYQTLMRSVLTQAFVPTARTSKRERKL